MSLINTEDPEHFKPIVSIDSKSIELIKAYLTNQDERVKLESSFENGLDVTVYCKLMTPIMNQHYELADKMVEAGVFRSKHDTRTTWKLVENEDDDNITLAELQHQLLM